MLLGDDTIGLCSVIDDKLEPLSCYPVNAPSIGYRGQKFGWTCDFHASLTSSSPSCVKGPGCLGGLSLLDAGVFP